MTSSRTNMFKLGSFEEDLAQGMQEKLLSNQDEKRSQRERITKAVDYIHAASEIFDATGFFNESEQLTRMLEKLAGKKTAGDNNAPSKEEMEFYQSLPVEERLEMLESSSAPGDWFPQLREKHKAHKHKPGMVEIESLLPNESEVGAVPGSDIIEMKSLAPEFERKMTPGEFSLVEKLPKKKL